MKRLGINRYIRNSPKLKMSINWWDLPDYRKIKINFELQKKLFSNILKTYPKIKIEKILKRSFFMVNNYTKIHRSITVGTLKRVLRLSNIKYEFIADKIIEISSIRNPILPFNLRNENGAELILAFLSDGHNPKDPTKNLKYQAGELESHKRIVDICQIILGKFHVRIDKEKDNKYQSYFPCVVGDILEFCGVPRGNKTKINPYFPKDILINKHLLVFALRRSFTDEGTCYPKYNSIRLERSVDITDIAKEMNLKLIYGKEFYIKLNINRYNNLILGENIGLKMLDVNSHLTPIKIRKNKDQSITLTWRLEITRIADIKKFKQRIGFLLTDKNKKVDEILLQYRKYNRFQDCLEAIKRLQKKKSYFTYQEFAELLGVHKDRGMFHLRRLIKNKYVIRSGKNKYCGVRND